MRLTMRPPSKWLTAPSRSSPGGTGSCSLPRNRERWVGQEPSEPCAAYTSTAASTPSRKACQRMRNHLPTLKHPLLESLGEGMRVDDRELQRRYFGSRPCDWSQVLATASG